MPDANQANEAAIDRHTANHTFSSKPDARQSTEATMPVTRFRPRYRALTPDEKNLHDEIKDKAAELDALFARVKPDPHFAKPAEPSRYRTLAITALEESVMWIVKELTS